MISFNNCTYIWTQDKSVVSHFINGLGNRRVALYTVDALLVPRVLYEHLLVSQRVIYSTVITKWFFKVFCIHTLKISTGKC